MKGVLFNAGLDSLLRIIILCVGILWLGSGIAVDYYGSDSEHHYLAVSYGKIAQSRLHGAIDDQLAMTINKVSSAWVVSNEQHYSFTPGVEFEYTILDFESLTAMTNGHLHTWSLPLNWRVNHPGYELVYNVKPAISVSSNVLRDPDLADRQSLQLNASFVYRSEVSSGLDWLAGLGGDHRFGEYRLYPMAGFIWRFNGDWEIQLAYPDTIIQKEISEQINLSFFAGPRGNQWHVFSKDKTQNSDVTYEDIVIGLSAIWQPHRVFKVTLDIESHTGRALELALEDGTVVRPDVDPSSGIIISGELIF